WSSGDEPGGGTERSPPFEAPAPTGDWGGAHDALFWPHAGEADIAIDAQILARATLCTPVEPSPERAHVQRCLAHLDRVRDALYELHFGAVDARTRRYDYKGSPLGAFLVASHLWCRDVLE